MGDIATRFSSAFRDFVIDGVPASGVNNPSKAEIRALGQLVEQRIGGAAAGLRFYATKAALDADTTRAPGTLAYVYDDPTPAANTVYHYETGGWVVDEAYYNGVASVVQPLVDQVEAAAATVGISLRLTDRNELVVFDGGGQRLAVWNAAGQFTADPSGQLLNLIRQGLPRDAGPQSFYANVISPVLLSHFYGQSLSLGLATEATLSGASPNPNALMPDTGVQDAAWTSGSEGLTGTQSLATSLVTLDATTNSHGLEPPVVGAVNQLTSRMRYADVIGANAGRGGYGITGLKKGYNGGNGPYALLISQFQKYATLTGGRALRSSLCWMQGEADANNAPITTPANNRASYKSDLRSIVTNYATDTGQADVHLFTYQLSSHTTRSPGYNYNIGLAQAEMGEEDDDVSVVTPMYPFDYQSDGVHLKSASSRKAGAYFGKAQDHFLRTGTKFEPLRPSSIARAGDTLTIRFAVPVGNLVVDTSVVSDPGDLGFEVFDSTNALVAITRVDVFGNTVIIKMAYSPANPVEVGYAIGSTLNGEPAGRLTGARGCLRDEDDTRASYDSSVALHNYCVMFRKAENYGA